MSEDSTTPEDSGAPDKELTEAVKDEPRARDLLHSMSVDMGQNMARLRELFGRSKTTTVPNTPQPAKPKVSQDDIDPILESLLESHNARSDTMREGLPKPITLPIENTNIGVVDTTLWRIGGYQEKAIPLPRHVAEDMNQKVPQAILRDLFRPVLKFPRTMVPVDLSFDAIGDKKRQETRAIMRANYRSYAQEKTLHSMENALIDMRKRLDQPWENYRPENPRPVSTSPFGNFPGF